MLAGAAQITFEPGIVTLADESVEHYVAMLQDRLGPLIAARAQLQGAGRWEEAEATLHDLYTRANRATDGTMTVDAPYLLILARA